MLEQLGATAFRPSSAGLGAGGEVILRDRAIDPDQLLLSLTYGRPFGALLSNSETFNLFVR